MTDFPTLRVPAAPMVIAVSGGCDSMTLLHAVLRAAERPELIHVVHVNHHLRGQESDADEQFVRKACADLGVECYVASRPVDPSASGIEASARDARYRVFVDVSQRVGASHVLTAHTADDQAETVLMHLGRGSGLDGMRGMPEERTLAEGITLMRPLLRTPRRLVREMAHAWDLRWREDASNNDLRYTRNRIRHTVLPSMVEIFGPSVVERIARTAGLIDDARSIVADVVRDHVRHGVTVDEDSACIDIDMLRSCSDGLRRQVLRAVLHEVLDDAAADAAAVERVAALVDAEAGSRASVRNHLMAIRERNAIVLTFQTQPTSFSLAITRPGTYVAGHSTLSVFVHDVATVTVDRDPAVAYFDVDAIHGSLLWRVWADGDRLQPLGMDGTALVSDLLTNAKVPSAHRREAMVLCDDVGIVWVCGLRLADRVKVHVATRSVYLATYTAPFIQPSNP
ncbi:MAG: tRNA lysidine(34) synthetase TilS [Candidatus Kapabacteria bacterium]|nr:tRNA lysidine(34) synthetase TilS [Candidatus Kapabacteria bacterium]